MSAEPRRRHGNFYGNQWRNDPRLELSGFLYRQLRRKLCRKLNRHPSQQLSKGSCLLLPREPLGGAKETGQKNLADLAAYCFTPHMVATRQSYSWVLTSMRQIVT